jgi:nicotinate-nucleotide adenylyltransferase
VPLLSVLPPLHNKTSPYLPNLNTLSSSFWSDKTVALFGGSFNPPHEGHRHIANLALTKLSCHHVWWMVTPGNPLKSHDNKTSYEHRLKQTQSFVSHPQMLVTDIETQLGTCYTFDTLKKLKHYFPRTHFIWIMGEDNLHTLGRWYRWRDIFDLVPVAVFHRRSQQETHLGTLKKLEKYRCSPHIIRSRLQTSQAHLPCWTLFHTKQNSQSSTNIRSQKNP